MFQIGGDLPVETGPVRLAMVPKGLETAQELFSALAAELDFPSYFGRNWDALLDCLRDLSWIKERTIVISHEEFPRLGAKELRWYLESLVDAAEAQASWSERELIAHFPEDLRAEVADFLRGR